MKSTKFVITTRFIDIAGEPAICLNKTSIINTSYFHKISQRFAVSDYQKLGIHMQYMYISAIFSTYSCQMLIALAHAQTFFSGVRSEGRRRDSFSGESSRGVS